MHLGLNSPLGTPAAQNHCLQQQVFSVLHCDKCVYIVFLVTQLFFNKLGGRGGNVVYTNTQCLPRVVLFPEQGNKPLCISPHFQGRCSTKLESFGPSLLMSPGQVVPLSSPVSALKKENKGKDEML